MIKTPKKQRQTFFTGLPLFSLSVQFELLVDKCFRKSVHCFDTLFTVDQNGDLDLGSGNHLDVDICFIQSLEHLGSNAGVGLHACADDRKPWLHCRQLRSYGDGGCRTQPAILHMQGQHCLSER